MTLNGHASKLFKNVFYDGLTKAKGEINMANRTTLKLHFDTISIEWLKSKLYYVFYHQRI